MHPITNRQWDRFCDEASYQPDAAHPEPERYLAHWHGGACPEALLDHPVVGISAVDAAHYCAWAGLSLPTGPEWEKAARGVDGRKYPWGSASPRGYGQYVDGEWVWRKRCQVAAGSTVPVGTYPETRTAWGCQDMIGNVAEICLEDADVDGRQLTETEVVHLRGSAYLRYGEVYRMACDHERRLRATGRNQWVGFRPIARLQ